MEKSLQLGIINFFSAFLNSYSLETDAKLELSLCLLSINILMHTHINYEKGVKNLTKTKARQFEQWKFDSTLNIQDLDIFFTRNKFKAPKIESIETEKNLTVNANTINYLKSKLLNIRQDFEEKTSRLEKSEIDLCMKEEILWDKNCLLDYLQMIEENLKALKNEESNLDKL